MVNNTILVDDTFCESTLNPSDTTDDLRNIDEIKYLDTELAETNNIKTNIFKSLILQLQDQVETLKEERKFLRGEIIHKNSFISYLISQNVQQIPEKTVNEPNNSSVLLEKIIGGNVPTSGTDNLPAFVNTYHVTTVTPRKKNTLADQNLWSSFDKTTSANESSMDGYDTSTNFNSTLASPVPLATATCQLHFEEQLKQVREQKHYNFLNQMKDTSELEKANENIDASDPVDENVDEATYQVGPWEIYNRGFASKMMMRMGYNGKGLGRLENGIIKPISIHNPSLTKPLPIQGKYNKGNEENKVKLLYILSSSMLNQMDEERLSNAHVKVKVQSHGGCTVDCMYSHLSKVIKCEPDYILLHIGSNDCGTKTSDEILQQYKRLVTYIEKRLPHVKVITSLPIVRCDNTRATCIQKNLKCKLQRAFLPCLDNSNVGLSHLGKKGLHLNNHGNKIMAKNIISLIKRL